MGFLMEVKTQPKLTGGPPTTLNQPLLSPQSKIRDLAVLAGVLAVPPLLNPPCAWLTNKTVPLGLVLLNSNWSIAVEKTTPLWDHTTIWLVTGGGLITLCTTSNKPDTLMVSITTHTSLDPPKAGNCVADASNSVGSISNCGATTKNSESELTTALAQVGAIGIAIDAGGIGFQLYSGGVYISSTCSSTRLNHAVTAVGYGNLSGQDYFTVKNSWGTAWGDNGYILMAANRNNQC